MTRMILLFAVMQIVNVIFSTFKYILTVKASPSIAAISNAASYTIHAIVTYLLVTQNPIHIIIITFMSNIIGVPIGRYILSKFEKDMLWVYNAIIKCTEEQVISIKKTLKEYTHINSVYEEVAKDEIYSMRFFAYTKEDSALIKQILKKHNALYYIVESR